MDARPDLSVLSLTAPTSGVAELKVTVGDTTANAGPTGAVVASTTQHRLSTDAVAVPGDPVLGTRAVVALTSGASSSGSRKVTLPNVAGTYFVLACADSGGVVNERNEGNHCRSRQGSRSRAVLTCG